MQNLKIRSALFPLVFSVLLFVSAVPRLLYAGPNDEIANVDGASISTELFEMRMSRLTQEGQ